MLFRKQRDKSKIILDWVTISYREIFGTIVVAILGITAAIALYYIYFRQPEPQEIASTEIRAAERALGRARSVSPPEREDLSEALKRASDELSAARELFRRELFEEAIQNAQSSRRKSDQVYQMVAAKVRHVAVLTNIGGNVDVQRANTQRWQAAYNGIQLFPRDRVRTLSGSGALLRYLEGDVMMTLEEDMVTIVLETVVDQTTGEAVAPVLLERGAITVESTEETIAAIRTPEAEAVLPGGGRLRGERDPTAEETEFASDAEATVRTTDGEEIELGGQEGVVVKKEGIELFEWIRPPLLNRPPDGKVFIVADPDKEVIRLGWDAVPNARHYRLEISRLPIFTGNLHYSTDLRETLARVAAPPLGTWWWRVYTVSTDGRRSLPAAARRFQVSARDVADQEAPPLQCTIPPLRMGTKVLIEGTTDPNALLTYSINDSQEMTMAVDASGRFSEFVELTRAGRNIITLHAQGPTGAVTVETVPVLYENY